MLLFIRRFYAHLNEALAEGLRDWCFRNGSLLIGLVYWLEEFFIRNEVYLNRIFIEIIRVWILVK